MMALVLRLWPPQDHIIWQYDHARDRSIAISIIRDKDLILHGPATSKWGLFHGPIFYYYIAPFYFLSQGDTFLPMLAMVALNLSAMIPLALLVKELFKDKRMVLLSLFLFAISYEQVEYARWLSNVCLVTPIMLWMMLVVWKITNGKLKQNFTKLTLIFGTLLGLLIQSEIFFLYFIPFFIVYFYFKKQPIKAYILTGVGLLIGLAPFVIGELKFGFRSVRSFIAESGADQLATKVSASQSLHKFIDHYSLTTKINISGGMPLLGFLVLVSILVATFYFGKRDKKDIQKALVFIALMFFSRLIIFLFPLVENIYINVTTGVLLGIFLAYVLSRLLKEKKYLIVLLSLVVVTFAQISELKTNVEANTPFSNYYFDPRNNLLTQHFDVMNYLYQEVGGRDYSISVLGYPYGVRTQWANIYQLYRDDNPNLKVPVWSGYYANGYHEDDYFKTFDHPSEVHFLIIQPLVKEYLPDFLIKKHMDQQDEATVLLKEEDIDGVRVQTRRPKNAEER